MKEYSARSRGLVVLVLLLLGACRSAALPATPVAPASTATSPATPAGQTSALSPWVKVRPGLGTPLYEVAARALPAPGAQAEVMAPMRAQVAAVHVRPGQRVAVGAAVVTVQMPEVLRAAFAYQGAGLRLAAYAPRREQLLQLKGDGLLRLADLAELDARIAEVKAVQLEAQATLHVAGVAPAEVASLGSNAGRVTLRSPIAGVVTSVSAMLGQVSDGNVALARVVGSGEARLEARLPLTLPSGVGFRLLVPGGERRSLQLLERAPLVDSQDGNALAWLALSPSASPAPELPAGLSARLEVYLDAAPTASAGAAAPPVLVPVRAVAYVDGQPRLFRRGAQGPESVAVQVLFTTGADALVGARDGAALSPSDEVAADASPYANRGSGGEP
jgi:cobalt-zinc-cadmium efflux system membrane fusion protein